jgi:hypothetical protein
MPKTIQVSDILASLALIVSMVSLYVSWREYRRDTSRLKIRLDFQVYPGKGSAYVVRIINIGRRDTTISKVFACMKSGKHYPVFDTLMLLKETETKEFTVPVAGFLKSNFHPLHIRAFEVEDTTGKPYRARTCWLGRRIRKVWKPEVDGLRPTNKGG